MADKRNIKRFRWFMSYLKERIWLEDMALQGWLLQNITMGVIYTFQKSEPVWMLYETDRFNLPKKPLLEEIQHKEIFMDMAVEMGWKEVTHDETLTYYFCKEYAEGEINELCNDEASRKLRAGKFKSYFDKKAKELVFWTLLLNLLCIIIRMEGKTLESVLFAWYEWFVLLYNVFAMGTALFLWRTGDLCKKELSHTREEWQELRDPARHKTVRKLILTIRRLNRFLQKEAQDGWVLTGVTLTRYFFEKSREEMTVYTLDSKWLTNKRLKKRMHKSLKDSKDLEGLNNDWQIQSVKDTEEKGWVFVCALENRAIIYKGETGKTTALNEARYDNSIRGLSLIGDYGLLLLISGIIGGIIGFVMAMYML